MEITGEYQINAPREQVWDALNDPDVLRKCIPGCEELTKTSDTSFAAKVRAKVGPVNARFAGEVTLQDLDPPKGYTISGEGKGGAAGFAKGSARVNLDENGGATVLRYDADAQVGGKLAQLGSRLVAGTADKLARQFFDNFSAQLGAPVQDVSPAPEAEAAGEAPAEQEAAPERKTEAPPPPTEAEQAEMAEAATRGASVGHARPAGPSKETAEEEPAPDRPDKDVGAGARTGVWVVGLIIVVLILLAVFAL